MSHCAERVVGRQGPPQRAHHGGGNPHTFFIVGHTFQRVAGNHALQQQRPTRRVGIDQAGNAPAVEQAQGVDLAPQFRVGHAGLQHQRRAVRPNDRGDVVVG